jgi:hypothetical protein
LEISGTLLPARFAPRTGAFVAAFFAGDFFAAVLVAIGAPRG